MKVRDFDVIVAGAGPIGSLTAEALARAGSRVALLEEHPCVGIPNHCSGLVSPRTLELAGVGETVVQRTYSSARVWAPGGRTLWLRSNAVQAVAIDRARFDQLLAARAVDAGVTLMLEARAAHFTRTRAGITVEARTVDGPVRVRASLLIGADGANSTVARWMGCAQRCEIVPAIKADIAFRGPGTDEIEIFLGRDVAPGWFGWIIPIGDGLARIGTGATKPPRRCFDAFLDRIRREFGDFDVGETRGAPLPLGPARDLISDGVMLVGAAARQTKPTTGGGLYFGVRAARLVAATALDALARGDCSRRALSAYERAWRRLDGRELAYGSWLRRGFRRLPDWGLDWLIALLGLSWTQRRLSRLGDMDYPSRLFAPKVALKRESTQPHAMRKRLVKRASDYVQFL